MDNQETEILRQPMFKTPMYMGDFNPLKQGGYNNMNDVSLYGCVWRSKKDNNTSAPATWDGGDTITPNTTDWEQVSGDYQAWLLNKDRPAQSEEYPFNNMGYVVLQKNIQDVSGTDKNLLTQDMFYKGEVGSRVPNTNTIFEVRYAFELAEDITIPAGCVLKFEGGSISANGNNDTITGNHTIISTDDYTQILSNIILSGSFDNSHLSVCNFGVKVGIDNSSANTTIFNTYIIPSMENILIPLLVPFVRNDVDYYYINDTITLNGQFDFICDGEIYYNGTDNNTAIIIGTSEVQSSRKEYKIALLRSKINVSGAIPDSYGVVFINVVLSHIILDRVNNFAYCVKMLADGMAVTSNVVDINYIGSNSYKILTLEAINAGWVNENEFYNGKFNGSGSLNPTAITINGNESHYANNNRFINCDIEGNSVGFDCTNATNNHGLYLRLERVTTPIVGNGIFLIMPFVTGDTGKLSKTNYISRENLLKSNRFNICDDYVSVISIKRNNVNKVLTPPFLIFPGNYLLSPAQEASGTELSSSASYGYIIDCSTIKTFRISSDVLARFSVVILDNTNTPIALTNENIDNYVAGNNLHLETLGFLKSGVDAFHTEIGFTNNTVRVFLGVDRRSNRLNIEGYGDNNINCIIMPDGVNTSVIYTAPQSTVKSQVSTMVFLEDSNKPIWWNGSAWVDATGTPV